MLGKFILAFFLYFGVTLTKPVLDPLEHEIQILSASKFDSLIPKYRTNSVVAVYFYTYDSTTVSHLTGWYNDLAKEIKGMVKIAAIDCVEYSSHCKKLGYSNNIVVYPVLPIPNYVYNGEMSLKTLKSHLFKYIPKDKVALISDLNNKEKSLIKVDDFLSQHVSVPKVLVFSEKEITNTLIFSLANEFDKKILFGFVPKSKIDPNSIEISKRFKVTTFPTIILLKGAEASKKPHFYKGKMEFKEIFEYLNVHAETFVMGGGFSDNEASSSVSKPWLSERIPEVHSQSYIDICGKHKAFCVIYLKNDDKLTPDEENMLVELEEMFTSHLSDRGTKFKWMWMNLFIEVNFAELFGQKNYLLPSVVILGTNKRLKYTLLPRNLDGDLQTANIDTIKSLLDKLMGGDARFVNLPGQKLPEFAVRTEKKNDEL